MAQALRRKIAVQTQAERALRESEMRWQFAVESQGEAMWDWDADKDELFLTAAARELFDLPDTGAKRPFADVMARVVVEDRILMQSQKDAIVGGTNSEWLSECRLSRLGETQRWVATRGRVMTRTADGRAHRVVCISSDVTQKKRSETEARRQRELLSRQARLVLLGELASALVHEINQPLTAIAGFAAVCARDVADNPEALELVRAIEEQALRAGKVTWRLRGFSRRERVGRTALALHEVVAEVAKWINMDRAGPDAVIDTAGVGAGLPQVHADRIELEQVLINLARNGIEAGLTSASVQRIAITALPGEQAGEIEIRVTDWGRGLPAAAAGLGSFQPFDEAVEQGLGLSICVSIIEGHGGRMWTRPNPEGGTVVHFTLPVAV
jgi:C4-dicarboxylate-specific signal transduction histidine kinase